MKRAALLILLSLTLAGCATPHRLEGSGIRTDAPVGWSLHCAETPRPVECGP